MGECLTTKPFYWEFDMISRNFGGMEKGAEDDIFRPKPKHDFGLVRIFATPPSFL